MPSTETHYARRLRTRRAFAFVGLSALMPGSIQWLAGNRGVGRLAGRVYGAVAFLGLLVALGLLLVRGPTVGFLLTPPVAFTVRVVLWALFVGWLVLLGDSWRLAAPLGLGRRTRLALTAITLVVALAVGSLTSVAASGFQAAGNVGVVLRGGGDRHDNAGRYNVLLLGVDGADGREGIRPDSINVASVDADTGRSVLIGLPRNLQNVRFLRSSPLHQLYPRGYACPDNACLLNGVYALGVEHADLYDEGLDPGVQAMKEAVSETVGLELNYYAMIDMAGFKSLIDAMGGIRLHVGKPIPLGGGSSKIHGYIEPGANVHLDGYHALWFARSRAESSDYERMLRQKCVMSAMAGQLDPVTVATRFVDLSEAGQDLLRTDVGTGQVLMLAELAVKARTHDIAALDLAPPLITPSDPDFELIRETVRAAIERSESLDEARPSPSASSPVPEQASQPDVVPDSALEPAPDPAPSAALESAAAAPLGDPAAADPVCSVP